MGKIYIIIYDGAGDRKIETLGNRTAFEAAVTPNLDRIAKLGRQALISVIGDDICPESDSGAMAILSYDPFKYYTGRGPLEGLGAGFLSENANAIAFRVNFASYNEESRALDRRTARDLSDEELQELTRDINDQINLEDLAGTQFKLISFGHHRGIIGFWGNSETLSGRVSNTDPAYQNINGFGVPVINYIPKPQICKPLIDQRSAEFAAEIVNTFIERSHKLLQEHPINQKRCQTKRLPANVLLFRDGGDSPRPLPSFREKFDWTLSMFGQIPAENGLAKLIGGEFSYSRRGKETEDAYLKQAAIQVVNATTDVIFIHLKGPDEPGHDSNPVAKVDAIEKIDYFFLPTLLDHLESTDYVVITCDHATPCSIGTHSADKVPIAIMGPNIDPDDTKSFGETEAASGGLSIQRAIEILEYIKKHQR